MARVSCLPASFARATGDAVCGTLLNLLLLTEDTKAIKVSARFQQTVSELRVARIARAGVVSKARSRNSCAHQTLHCMC